MAKVLPGDKNPGTARVQTGAASPKNALDRNFPVLTKGGSLSGIGDAEMPTCGAGFLQFSNKMVYPAPEPSGESFVKAGVNGAQNRFINRQRQAVHIDARYSLNRMTTEYMTFEQELESAFFNYAHLTGAVELYMQLLETPSLQSAFSKTMTGQEIEWKTIHRFMNLADQTVVWYPDLPVGQIVQQKNRIIGLLYGIFVSRMIGLVDYYLASILNNRFGHTEKSGSCWDAFFQKTKIDLLARTNGQQIYSLLQERHKIEHNKAQIDQTFVDRLMKKGVTHSYAAGDSIQKSHMDVLAARDAIREFVADVDSLITSSLVAEPRI